MAIKAYLRLNGVSYFDYDIVCVDDNCKMFCSSKYSNLTFVNEMTCYNLEYRNYTMRLFDSFTPKKGDKIFISKGIDIPLQDIKRCYTLCKEDEGQCNVFAPFDSHKRSARKEYTSYRVAPRLKKVFVSSNVSFIDIEYLKNKYCLTDNDFEDSDNITELTFLRHIDDAYLKLLRREYNKPCILSSDLPISSDIKLSVDTLYMVYKLSRERVTSEEKEQNLLTLLAVINQSNWRDYPYTMREFHNLCYNYGGPYYSLSKRTDRPKYAKIVMDTEDYSNPNPEDKALLRALIMKIMGIMEGEIKYCDYQTLEKKLSEFGMSQSVFSNYFKTMCRIELRNEKEN